MCVLESDSALTVSQLKTAIFTWYAYSLKEALSFMLESYSVPTKSLVDPSVNLIEIVKISKGFKGYRIHFASEMRSNGTQMSNYNSYFAGVEKAGNMLKIAPQGLEDVLLILGLSEEALPAIFSQWGTGSWSSLNLDAGVILGSYAATHLQKGTYGFKPKEGVEQVAYISYNFKGYREF